jgi:hypothetical protein
VQPGNPLRCPTWLAAIIDGAAFVEEIDDAGDTR